MVLGVGAWFHAPLQHVSFAVSGDITSATACFGFGVSLSQSSSSEPSSDGEGDGANSTRKKATRLNYRYRIDFGRHRRGSTAGSDDLDDLAALPQACTPRSETRGCNL